MTDIANIDALYSRALASCEEDRIEDGVMLLREAIAADPGQARLHRLLGMALSRLDRNEEALASIGCAIALEPRRAELHGNRADVLVALGRLDAAVESYDRALALAPGSVEDWCNRGAVLIDLKRYEDAVASFERALVLSPDFAPAHYNHGNALVALERPAEAVASFDKAIALVPDYADAHNNRANVFDRLDRPNEALASAQRALSIDAGHRGALLTSGILLRKLGRCEEALSACDRALLLTPDDAEALTARADTLIELERFDEAIAALDRIIACEPDSATAKWNKSVLCLGLGRFREGWAFYEHRWAGARGLVPRPYRQPRWDGGRVAGSLLLWSEQGLGDEILHASMLPDVLGRTDDVVLEVEPRLAPLFARSFPNVKIIGLGPAPYRGAVAAQLPLGDLGRHFRTSWESFPQRERGYLVADESRSRSLRNRLAGDGREIIGLSWISKAPVGGAARSVPLRDFAALLRLPGCRFIDLQYGETDAERDAVERELGVRVERLADIDNTNDLDGLAALMTACDAVVTIDNTTVHLAGALGRPTWVMLPYGHSRIWYWFRDRETSLWYPRAHVHRQRRGQPWAEVVASIAAKVADISG
ncbi:MAG: tetratricopeptide repeat protein [Xanthobacteraceae bacterium]